MRSEKGEIPELEPLPACPQVLNFGLDQLHQNTVHGLAVAAHGSVPEIVLDGAAGELAAPRRQLQRVHVEDELERRFRT